MGYTYSEFRVSSRFAISSLKRLNTGRDLLYYTCLQIAVNRRRLQAPRSQGTNYPRKTYPDLPPTCQSLRTRDPVHTRCVVPTVPRSRSAGSRETIPIHCGSLIKTAVNRPFLKSRIPAPENTRCVDTRCVVPTVHVARLQSFGSRESIPKSERYPYPWACVCVRVEPAFLPRWRRCGQNLAPNPVSMPPVWYVYSTPIKKISVDPIGPKKLCFLLGFVMQSGLSFVRESNPQADPWQMLDKTRPEAANVGTWPLTHHRGSPWFLGVPVCPDCILDPPRVWVFTYCSIVLSIVLQTVKAF